MYPTPSVRSARKGAITAGTIFAVTLAIVAGLIFACAFKILVLDRKPQEKEVKPQKQLTVAAANVLNQTKISADLVKTVNVSDEVYAGWEREVRKRGGMLFGRQPVGRITKAPLNAEEPIFNDQLEKFEYPRPVSELIDPGKQAVVIRIPARQVMVQVNDRVDLQATLSSTQPIFGPRQGANATALLGENLRVVARFNSTESSARPTPSNTPTWTYTLEVDPWQSAIVELARRAGATFNLSVSSRKGEDGSPTTASADPDSARGQEARYQQVKGNFEKYGTVSEKDLSILFAVEPPPPPTPKFVVERFYGNSQGAPAVYDVVAPQGDTKTRPAGPAPSKGDVPTKSGMGQPRPNVVASAGGMQLARNTNYQLASTRGQAATGTPGSGAAAGGRSGAIVFGAPTQSTADCVNCGQKQ